MRLARMQAGRLRYIGSSGLNLAVKVHKETKSVFSIKLRGEATMKKQEVGARRGRCVSLCLCAPRASDRSRYTRHGVDCCASASLI